MKRKSRFKWVRCNLVVFEGRVGARIVRPGWCLIWGCNRVGTVGPYYNSLHDMCYRHRAGYVWTVRTGEKTAIHGKPPLTLRQAKAECETKFKEVMGLQ